MAADKELIKELEKYQRVLSHKRLLANERKETSMNARKPEKPDRLK